MWLWHKFCVIEGHLGTGIFVEGLVSLKVGSTSENGWANSFYRLESVFGGFKSIAER